MPETSTSKSKPPYLLGLLCLIPLVGALVGIGLLLYGLIKYKDKWLVIIGAFGIVFTIATYSFLFYFMKHGNLVKKGFTNISQMQLNGLVDNIEFYKLQNGHYPDSLSQLLDTTKIIWIDDPIQTWAGRKNHYYIYKRLENKYSVSSSGQDGIPNTPDDLFPQIKITDSSLIGLTRLAH